MGEEEEEEEEEKKKEEEEEERVEAGRWRDEQETYRQKEALRRI